MERKEWEKEQRKREVGEEGDRKTGGEREREKGKKGDRKTREAGETERKGRRKK